MNIIYSPFYCFKVSEPTPLRYIVAETYLEFLKLAAADKECVIEYAIYRREQDEARHNLCDMLYAKKINLDEFSSLNMLDHKVIGALFEYRQQQRRKGHVFGAFY